MEKEEIFTVYLLFKRYGPSTLLNCMHGICLAEAIEDNPQSWLDYANTLQKHEESIYCMLRAVATTGKQDAEVAEAYTVVEKMRLKNTKKKRVTSGRPRAQYKQGGNPER